MQCCHTLRAGVFPCNLAGIAYIGSILRKRVYVKLDDLRKYVRELLNSSSGCSWLQSQSFRSIGTTRKKKFMS